MTVMVIGGAGYIGAHVVRLLQQRGERVVVVDDLSTGAESRVGDSRLVRLDVATPDAPATLEQVLRGERVDAVVHFAGKKRVGESVERPLFYARQNIGGMVNVLEAMHAAGVGRLVFSSSAAVYGMPPVARATEETATVPINPYGRSKLAGEWLVGDAARAWGLDGVSLRYFNVAGAGWPDLGDPAALNLVTIVLDRMRRGLAPEVYGDDYPTPDGTGIRDYVHVLDLAEAHLAALDRLDDAANPHAGYPGAGADGTATGDAASPPDAPAAPGSHRVFNVGTGSGFSVREVLAELSRASGREITPVVTPRRPGDPPELIADPARIGAELGWRARHALPEIIASAWEADLAAHGA